MKVFCEEKKKEKKKKNMEEVHLHLLKLKILNIKGAGKTLLFILNCISYIFTNYIQCLI